MKTEKVLSDFRVGLMTFSAIFFLILGVTFAGGDKGLLFQKTVTLKALLPDVSGLKKGASVTMGGMTVGRVTEIDFAEATSGRQIEILMEVRSDIRERIKTDSLPAVRTQGMLGDRYIDISAGSEGASILADGKPLVGSESSDFDAALHQTSDVLQEMETLLATVNKQQGTVGQLFYNEKLYGQMTEISEQIKDLLRDFKQHPRRYVKLSMF